MNSYLGMRQKVFWKVQKSRFPSPNIKLIIQLTAPVAIFFRGGANYNFDVFPLMAEWWVDNRRPSITRNEVSLCDSALQSVSPVVCLTKQNSKIKFTPAEQWWGLYVLLSFHRTGLSLSLSLLETSQVAQFD